MKIILALLILISIKLNAQPGGGARIDAMAGAGVALSGIGSIHMNQAGLSQIESPTLALNYQKPFSGQSIAVQSLVFVLPLKKQVLGFLLHQYGFDTYREQQIALSYARKFGPTLSAGMSLSYQQLSIVNYGKSKALSVDAGLQFQTNKTLILGAHISNISKNALSQELQYADLPLSIQFGAAYQSSEQVLIALALEQNLNANTDARLGLEYHPISLIALRGGLSVNPFREYGGLGLLYKALQLDLGFSTHQNLGYATQIGLAYAF